MVDRYKLARAKGKQHFQAAVEADQELLARFGVGLLSVDNGMRIVFKKALRQDRVNPWDVIHLTPKLWGWLRPLLAELQEFRSASRVNGVEKNAGRNGHSFRDPTAPRR